MTRWHALPLLVLAGCLGTTPEEAAEEALGDVNHQTAQADGYGVGPRHRPGQPCLVCHSDAHNPGGKIFVIAGTVYETGPNPPSDQGIEGVFVTMTDAEGFTFEAETNAVGTFFVRVESGLQEPRRVGEGELRIPSAPVFPLEVSVARGADEAAMRSVIHREGSCAACHQREESEESPGVVVLIEEPAP